MTTKKEWFLEKEGGTKEETEKIKEAENLELVSCSEIIKPEEYFGFVEFSERTIWFPTELTFENAIEIGRKILIWSQEEPDYPIRIYFQSVGGSLHGTLFLLNIIETCKAPVYGLNLGYAASAAAFVFLGCDKRFCLSNSKFLFHELRGGAVGAFKDLKDEIKDLEEDMDSLIDLLERKTSYTRTEIKEKITREWTVRAKEAVDRKICDEILTAI